MVLNYSISLFFLRRWNKKLEKEGLAAADDREIERMQRAKRNEQRLELEKVKQRRLEREREREERAQLMELEQRQRDNDKFSKWSRDEDDFHLQQARLRSKIRIIDGRAKPIDLVRRPVTPDESLGSSSCVIMYSLNRRKTSHDSNFQVDVTGS